jgi:hypothetical protein
LQYNDSCCFSDLIDAEIDEEKSVVFASILSRVEAVHTNGSSLPRLGSLCTPQNAIAELFLDFCHQEGRILHY